MTTTVFAGPTVSAEQVRAVLPDAQVHGPAELGSVYRAVLAGSTTIAIIDGYFEHRLPVWHKEILWALSRGVRVYGAASMGALRAAELVAFGMIGVGRIFEWFRDGELEDDDEVAIVHDERGAQFRARSDAMVNVRATVSRARAHGILSPKEAERLLTVVKLAPYPERNLRLAAAQVGLDTDVRETFLTWLERGGTHDLKGEDALALLRRISGERDAEPAARVNFCFAHTEAWHELVRSEERAARTASAQEPVPNEAFLADLFEEVQLAAPQHVQAILTHASRIARSRGNEGDQRSGASSQFEVLACLPDALRARDQYTALAERAADKSARLASSGRPAVKLAREELVRWHFERQGRPIPVDLEAYAEDLAFGELEDFILAIAREHWYLTQLGPLR